ncbi:MAG: carbohydrate kinase, partial [Candidatus Bipolaricaulia bacterium]
MPTVITLGEVLIDFIATETGPLRDAPGFLKRAGGAPANVAVGISRLKVSAGFIGKVGDDEFGGFLRGVLETNRVDVTCLKYTSAAQTPLAFVSLTETGVPDFTFYRSPGADEKLSVDDIDEAYIQTGRVLHYGSLSLTSEPSRSATFRAVQYAHQGELIVSMDPNLRLSLWKDEATAKRVIREGISRSHLLKLSGEEANYLTGADSLEQASDILRNWGPVWVVITRGKKGCAYRLQDRYGEIPGYTVETVDTTGAGDGFLAGLLSYLVQQKPLSDLSDWSAEAVEDALRYANAVAALTTTSYGGIDALPDVTKVRDFLHNL